MHAHCKHSKYFWHIENEDGPIIVHELLMVKDARGAMNRVGAWSVVAHVAACDVCKGWAAHLVLTIHRTVITSVALMLIAHQLHGLPSVWHDCVHMVV